MEQWLPLMEIFTRSPCPVGEACLYIQNKGLPGSLLWKLVPDVLARTVPFHEAQDEDENGLNIDRNGNRKNTKRLKLGKCMWIETLPCAVQSSLLTFLSAEYKRFRLGDLQTLASHLITSPNLDYWSSRAARDLYTTVCDHTDSTREDLKDYSLPEWLRDYDQDKNFLFPWIPISNVGTQASLSVEAEVEKHGDCCSKAGDDKRAETELNESTVKSTEGHNDSSCISRATSASVELLTNFAEEETSNSSFDPELHIKAMAIREELLNMHSSSGFSGFGNKFRAFLACGPPREVLTVIKPWEVDDEITMKLVETLITTEDGYAWCTDMLCSLLLPKLLFLKMPASRVLVSAVLQAGKVHQRATVDGLLLPSMLHKEGLNPALCEVLKRIISECLSPEHASSFLEKLPFTNKQTHIICIPCHRSELSNCIIWTESIFTLFQDILNKYASLRLEAIINLAFALDVLTDEFSKSLKFGNFLLCFVNKYGSFVKPHRFLLENVTKRTNTFLTKTILSKLASL